MSDHHQERYINREDVKDHNEVPVEFDEREGTDIFCTICSGLFAIILFIICIAALNKDNLAKMTYPADGEGTLCGYDLPDYPLLYYTSFDDPVKRLCVAHCPKEGDESLSCKPTKGLSCQKNDNPDFQVQIYDTEVVHNRVGLFCMPTDEESRGKIEDLSQVYSKNAFMGFYDAFWTTTWLSVVLGIVYVALMQFFPKLMVKWMMVLGGLVFFVTGLLIIILPDGHILLRLVCGFAILLLGGMVAFTLWKDQYRKELVVCARLMECATEVLQSNWLILSYIPIFIVLMFGLIVLIGFELLAVWSVSELKFDPNKPFYETTGFGSHFLSLLIFIEFYWGMSFLKESFNFCVSGYAAHWYCLNETDEQKIKGTKAFQSFLLLLKYHWGSVVGGSFILAILYYADLFFDFFLGSNDQGDGGQAKKKRDIEQSAFNREQDNIARTSFRGCVSMFNLTRSQSMGYINVIPIPYCNASRYCELMADESGFYDRSQTTNRLFRLSAHIFWMGLCALIAIQANKVVAKPMAIQGVIIIFVLAMFMITYFICLHGDISEGLLISVFIEEKLTGQMDHIDKGSPSMRQLYQDDKNKFFDENNTRTDFLKSLFSLD